ncbi:uncharacterized protein [Salminus brasiliensis]|uniref:uncharacterized protein n=1 Tax=Salminus brasiliensis TaxID=930266 RepID=UPI003B839BB3
MAMCAEKMYQAICTWRKVTIHITNSSSLYTLEQPRTYTYSGDCQHPPHLTIAKNTKEECSFSKTDGSACGVVGVLTYRILTDKKKYVGELAIMFSVPYSYKCYTNWFALGIFPPGVPCDEKLYNKMYYESGPFTRGPGTGSSITYSNKAALVYGTMSPQGESEMKVELRDVYCYRTQIDDSQPLSL